MCASTHSHRECVFYDTYHKEMIRWAKITKLRQSEIVWDFYNINKYHYSNTEIII